jgi:two-component system nitrogen regulation response regulator GlnG/two-component system response regulator HydG
MAGDTRGGSDAFLAIQGFIGAARSRRKSSMVDDRSTIEGTLEDLPAFARSGPALEALALIVAWSREEPHRIGEVAIVDCEQILGRGGARPEDDVPRARLAQQRPKCLTLTGPIGSLRISRVQLRLKPIEGGLFVESVGRCPMLLNGERAERGEVRHGDTIQLKNELVFVVVRRRKDMLALRSYPADRALEFGRADGCGFVGESEAAWLLRDRLAFIARSEGHVLIRGESGSGKELAARAVHALSSRAARPLVSRNAATVPEGLVDAELFGNVKNYPNPGTAEREGLIGEADGSTLFLDEIGELPVHLQAHLLRVLDRGGEYQRLGEARVRKADLRVVAATNRAIDELKHDFAARLTLRVDVPSLAERREDVPLLVRHILERAAATNDHVAEAFFTAWPGGTARVEPDLVDRLVRHAYRTQTRELEQLLWQALAESTGHARRAHRGRRAPPRGRGRGARAARRAHARGHRGVPRAERRQRDTRGARARVQEPLRALPRDEEARHPARL